MRIGSARNYAITALQQGELRSRGRAVSDPKEAPASNLVFAGAGPLGIGPGPGGAGGATGTGRQPGKPAVEVALEQGDARRVAARLTTTAADVDRLRHAHDGAEDELRQRLSDISQTSTEISRHLDYTYYSLLEKVGLLAGTIQSFHSLATQSQTLIDNFATETAKLDAETRRKIEHARRTNEARAGRIHALETRGLQAENKARDLGARLDRARARVQEWEEQEAESRRRWGRVWGGVSWTLVAVLVAVVAVLAGKWWYRGSSWWFPGGGGGGDTSLEISPTDATPSLGLDADAVERLRASASLPDDVRSVLDEIEERSRGRGPAGEQAGGEGDPGPAPEAGGEHERERERHTVHDDKLHVLDEL